MEEIDKIRFGDVGTIFRIRILDSGVPVDLSGCTTKEILFRKPDDTSVTKTASFFTDGKDGYIQYVTTSGDLDISGVWNIQGFIGFSTQSWHTTIDSFLVSTNI